MIYCLSFYRFDCKRKLTGQLLLICKKEKEIGSQHQQCGQSGQSLITIGQPHDQGYSNHKQQEGKKKGEANSLHSHCSCSLDHHSLPYLIGSGIGTIHIHDFFLTLCGRT